MIVKNKYMENLDKYKSIIKRIRKVYSNFLDINEYDMTIENYDDFIMCGGLNDNRYQEIIKKLEDEFELSLLNIFWNDEDGFQDLTDDKYRTFDGIADYIFNK